jgi:hypothetical protein
VSRKWRKAKMRLEPLVTPTRAVPYGPPVAKTVKPHRPSNDTVKAVALVGATIAAPYLLRGLLKLLSKR